MTAPALPRAAADRIACAIVATAVRRLRDAAPERTIREQPKDDRFGAALPRNAMVKLEDWT